MSSIWRTVRQNSAIYCVLTFLHTGMGGGKGDCKCANSVNLHNDWQLSHIGLNAHIECWPMLSIYWAQFEQHNIVLYVYDIIQLLSFKILLSKLQESLWVFNYVIKRNRQVMSTVQDRAAQHSAVRSTWEYMVRVHKHLYKSTFYTKLQVSCNIVVIWDKSGHWSTLKRIHENIPTKTTLS